MQKMRIRMPKDVIKKLQKVARITGKSFEEIVIACARHGLVTLSELSQEDCRDILTLWGFNLDEKEFAWEDMKRELGLDVQAGEEENMTEERQTDLTADIERLEDLYRVVPSTLEAIAESVDRSINPHKYVDDPND